MEEWPGIVCSVSRGNGDEPDLSAELLCRNNGGSEAGDALGTCWLFPGGFWVFVRAGDPGSFCSLRSGPGVLTVLYSSHPLRRFCPLINYLMKEFLAN